MGGIEKRKREELGGREMKEGTWEERVRRREKGKEREGEKKLRWRGKRKNS